MNRETIVEAYLKRLDLSRQDPILKDPSFSGLSEILRRHVATLPFSSVGPRLGEDLPLDLEALYQRIVVKGRGGYCFEHNALIYEILEELGFDVSFYLARVIYNQDIHPGLTHRFNVVTLDGDQRYLVDGGFGPLGPSLPVNMSGAESRSDAHPVFRVCEVEAGVFHLQTFKKGVYFSLYKFELARYGQADCELGHFYSHKHPKAAFVNHLVVSRILDNEVRSLRNRGYRILRPEGDEDLPIRDPAHLQGLLFDAFDIPVSDKESRRLFGEA